VKISKWVSTFQCGILLVSILHLVTAWYVQPIQAQTSALTVSQAQKGVNVTLAGRFELYFNATNGGEITRYYDLSIDPSRRNNLVLPVNQSYQQPSPYNLLPLFSSILYNPSVERFKALGSTGGDGNAILNVLGNDTDYVILQTTARIMDAAGGVFGDVYGNANYINSTWLIRSDGYIFLERTLYTQDYAVMQGKYRWYPFYLIRTTGFTDTATFYLFNTTYAYTYTVSRDTYKNDYKVYPKLPVDENGYFGVAAPFSNTSLGGDGTSSIILVYDLGSSSGISEWKSDCFTDSSGFGGTEFGAVHEFDVDYNITTLSYHAMIVLTHDLVTEHNATTFAVDFSKNPVFPLAKTSLTADKIFYELGEPFVINVSVAFDYNMINLSKTLTLTDEFGHTLWHNNYGIVNVSRGETWSNVQLLNHTISAIIASDDYTFTFRLLSEQGIAVGSDSVSLIVTVKARQFGKARMGQNMDTSYKDYKGVTRYLMREDGWVTSISMWFGSEGLEATVAIYTHPEGKLIVQSQSETITSTGWHNFTVPRTFIFSGFYGLAWKNSENATVAYDAGSRDQTARSPESYDEPFSPTFVASQFFDTEISIYATYDPVVTKVGLSRYPETPSYDENVTVMAYAKDGGILTEPVVLSFSTNILDWVNVTMTPDERLYIAQFSPKPYNTSVYYKAYAYDWAGYPVDSEIGSYQVADFRPPIVSYIERTPMSPNYNETVSVSAGISEPLNASGVKLVILSYWDGSAWTNATMAQENKLYKATLPALPYGTTVNYTVFAFDHAGNVATMDIYSYITADSYLPIARIDQPIHGSYLSGQVDVIIFGNDPNMDRMELAINSTVVQKWNSSGTWVFNWIPTNYTDGTYLLRLTAFDKAGNIAKQEITVTIDNTSPTIKIPTWTPTEPSAYQIVTVKVEINDSPEGSIQNVTLWYKNSDSSEWQFEEMILIDGKWTATIPEQSGDTVLRFYIESYDKAGNIAKTPIYQYPLKEQPNLQLALLYSFALIVAAFFGILGTIIYLTRRRKNRKASATSMQTIRFIHIAFNQFSITSKV